MQMSKLLGNRRKEYILDVICILQNLFWGSSGRRSRPVQWARYLSTQNRRSIPLSLVCSRKKQGCLRKCPCKYHTEVSRFVLEILEKFKVIASEFDP